MRRLSALLVLLAACAGCHVAYRTDEVRDEEIQRQGRWTARDQEARALLHAEPPPAFGEAADPDRPIRNPSIERKLVDIVEVGGVSIPIPRPSRAIGFLFGFEWDPKYYYLVGSRSYVLLRRDAEPVVIEEGGDDQERIIPVHPGTVHFAPCPGTEPLPWTAPSRREVEAAEKLSPPIELPGAKTKSTTAP